MKRLAFLMAAATAVLMSCQREELEAVKPVPEPTGRTYRFELAEGETRATLGDEGVFWEAGDQVGLFLGDGASVAGDVDVTTTPKTVSFPADNPLPAGTVVRAYYPYQADNTNAAAAKIVFPAAQRGGSVSAMPMVGIPFEVKEGADGTNGVIRSLNLGAVIDFRVYSAKYAGEQIKSIRFTVTSGTNPVSGTATLDLTGVNSGAEASLAVSWPENAPISSSVVLSQAATVAATKDAAAEGHLYMVVAPGTYSGTITIVTNAATYTFPFANQALARNVLKRFNMNLESANATQDRNVWYRKTTSMDEIVSGGTYLIVYETSGPYAFKPILNSGKTGLVAGESNVLAVTVENGSIRSTEIVDECRVVLEASGNNYYMKAVGASGYYFYPYSSNIAATSNASTACTISYSSGVVNITRGNNNYFKYSTSSGYFKGSTYNNSSELALYVLEDLSSNVQRLHFSEEYVTYLINNQPTPVVFSNTPVLSGYQTDVTYTSSNPSVATVDASTGVVTVNGIGKTVITATAAASGNYQQASASYTLTVWNEPTYSVENDRVAAYLDYVETHPYGPVYPDDYGTSWITTFSSGTGQNNRLDWPKPVPVSWETPISGTPTVLVYNDADHTSQEPTANVTKTSSTSADIYNLIPGKKYYYKVMAGDNLLKTGEFRTVGRRRMIKVGVSDYGENYANNCRDFGGLLTVDGRRVKFGKIFRGSNMDDTYKNDEKDYLLENMKIGLDVDLRETSGKNPLGVTVSDETYNSIGDLTNSEKMKHTIRAIFDAVSAGKGIYIHCKVGADRTGYVCMLLEAILGVRQDLCDTDYEMTSFSGAVGTRIRGDISKIYYYYPRGIEFIYGKSGATFQEKAINYVTSLEGISLEDVQAFQAAMLEVVQ